MDAARDPASKPGDAPAAQAAAAALVGEFVVLRPLVEADAALTLAWRLGARAHLLNVGAQNEADQRRWLGNRPASEKNYIIELPATAASAGVEAEPGQPVGMLSLIGIDPVHCHAESARFLIGDEKAVRGRPVAVEAMKLLYELAFDTLGLHRVFGSVAASNHLMIRWQKYLGMREEGRLRDHYFMNGAFVDAVCLGILADEFRADALPKMKALIAAGRAAGRR